MCFNPGPEGRVPSPNRYIADAKFCFCKNNKRIIIIGTPRRSERTRVQERVEYRESSMECDTQSDSDEEENSEPLSYRLKLHAADPRYITNSEDCNRGDVILTVEQVRELIAMRETSEEGTATIWLTTAEMGFSLTEEQDDVVCTKDVKEGKITDRFLAPAISRWQELGRIRTGKPQMLEENWRTCIRDGVEPI